MQFLLSTVLSPVRVSMLSSAVSKIETIRGTEVESERERIKKKIKIDKFIEGERRERGERGQKEKEEQSV